KKLKNSLLTNLTTKPGTKEPSDLGSPLKILGKYRYDAGNFSGGATIEKDPGEKMFSGNPGLPDFTSAYLGYEGKGILRKLIIGDYSACFGQGLNVNTGLSVGSSLSSRGYVPVRNELKEYTSTDENNFFRGTAAELKYKNFSGVFYLSSNSIDATAGTSSGKPGWVENFYQAGYHNTASLLLKKDVLRENSAGANISYSFKQASIGATWSADKLSMPLVNDDSDLSDLYNFSGSSATGYSIYYNALFGKIFLFGEAAANDMLKKAFFQGVAMRPSDRLTFNLFYRNYQPGYYSLHGRNQGSSPGWNENSLSAGFTFEAAKHLFINGGADLIHYPWLKYRTSSPSSAFRDELRLSYIPTGKLTVEILYQYRMSMADSSEFTGVPVLEETRTTYFKASVKYTVSEKLTLGMRGDHKFVNTTGDKGMLVSADMSLKPGKLPLTIWMRYCIFSIDDWKARIYTYENDLLYSYSVPALSGDGSRSYVMVKWDLGKNIDLRLKYGLTVKDKVNTDEVKFQIRMVF
ncbi:MAG TPA: hypothetical protein VHO68_01030, partial [Bacteroidales bacterium]|nr:hypothetical protein [Bacteroidales bacterium]